MGNDDDLISSLRLAKQLGQPVFFIANGDLHPMTLCGRYSRSVAPSECSFQA